MSDGKSLDDNFRDSPIFKVLLQEIPRLVRQADEHQAEFERLWEQDYAIVGKVLRCHLLLEHYLDRYIRTANPAIVEWDSVRLTFYQKLVLASHPQSVLVIVGPGIIAINRLRNRLVHNLSVSFDENELQEVRQFVAIKYHGLEQEPPTGIEMIEDFTATACTFLAGVVEDIKHKCPEVGLQGLNKWWQEAIDDLSEDDKEFR